MTATMTDETPRVWVSCLHCYNNGHLVGDWFEATEADTITIADVHRGSGKAYAACEELWVMDHEFIPVTGEFGLLEAAEWGRAYEEAGAERWPAVCAWVQSGMHVTEGTGEIPVLSEFEERYAGHWESFEEYADMFAEETDLMDRWPDEAKRYFDWSAWRRDLAYDYTVCDAPAPEYGVFIFHNM